MLDSQRVTAPPSLRTRSGEPLLLLHGLGTSRRDFTAVIPALTDRFDVINLDLRCPAPDHRGVLLTEGRILSHVSACSAAVQSTSDVYVGAANCGMTAPTTPGPVLSPIRRTRRPDSDNSAS